jgi:hypothetical protein
LSVTDRAKLNAEGLEPVMVELARWYRATYFDEGAANKEVPIRQYVGCYIDRWATV